MAKSRRFEEKFGWDVNCGTTEEGCRTNEDDCGATEEGCGTNKDNLVCNGLKVLFICSGLAIANSMTECGNTSSLLESNGSWLDVMDWIGFVITDVMMGWSIIRSSLLDAALL